MICFFCKSHKFYEFIGSFIYDLIAAKSPLLKHIFYHPIVILARIWPDSLTWPCSVHIKKESKTGSPVLAVIIHTVKSRLFQMKRPSVDQIPNSAARFFIYVGI